MTTNEALPPALAHGALVPVFDGIYMVTGAMKVAPEWGGMQFSRNMIIVHEGDSLTLVNTLRMNDDGLAALDTLGRVDHIVRLGAFHGRDDAFYARRYSDALVWAPAGTQHERGVSQDRNLSGTDTPIADAKAILFDSPDAREALLVLDREGGIVIACDAMHNWEQADEFWDDATVASMGAGFIKRCNFGPGWVKAAPPTRADLQMLAALKFRHLLSAHGVPLLHEAREALDARLTEYRGG